MIIKVCGLVGAENLLEVDALGVDFLGRIFYPKSPRYMGEEELVKSRTKQVGVYVDADTDHILETVRTHRLQGVQLHGRESTEQMEILRSQGLTVFKAIRVGEELPSAEIEYYGAFCDYILLDTKGAKPGGNGERFDWKLLDYYPSDTPFLLSGGLAPEHAESIKTLTHPAFKGIDLNSGFEKAPGIKDIERLETFINEIRSRQIQA
jgi:phosphoribosylanthranilate isomerase